MKITLALVIGWVVLATYADTLFKSATSWRGTEFILGVTCYAACGVFALATFRRQQWGWVILVWNICSLAISMGLSVLIFHEPFTARRAIASALVLTASFLAE